MVEAIAERPALAVGDQVELAEAVAHCKVPVGSRGVIVVDGLPWGMCTVAFGRDPERGKAYLLRPQHLRRVEDTAAQGIADMPGAAAGGRR